MSVRVMWCVLLLAACSSPEPSFEDRRALDHNRAGAEAFQRGDAAAAALHFERALELGRALGDRAVQADAQNNLGIALESIGRTDEARARYEAARELCRSVSAESDVFSGVHWPGVLATELNLARLASARGDHAAAEAAVAAARVAAAELDSRAADVDVAKQAAHAAFARDGATDAVAAAAEEAQRRAQRLERTAANLARESDAALILAAVRLARGERDAALAQAQSAARLAREVSDRGLVAGALEQLGAIDAAAGRHAEARERFELALDVHVRRPNVVRARAVLARLIELARAERRDDLVSEYSARLQALDASPAVGNELP